MEPTGVSDTVTISDQEQGSYMKIETLRGKNPIEIHGALCEVYGEFAVDRSRVSHWTNRFRGGCVNIDNDPRLGRPRSVNFVADALEEDRRATCQHEELSRAKGIITSQENLQEATSVALG